MTEDEHTTMKDVDHTNPHTGESAGHLFYRGPIIAADGGNDPTADGNNTKPTETNRSMRSVSHTPPNDADTVNRVFERGSQTETKSTTERESEE